MLTGAKLSAPTRVSIASKGAVRYGRAQDVLEHIVAKDRVLCKFGNHGCIRSCMSFCAKPLTGRFFPGLRVKWAQCWARYDRKANVAPLNTRMHQLGNKYALKSAQKKEIS